MRITKKGQVTIPLHIREQLGLLPHTEVDFLVEDGAVRIVKVDPRRGSPGGPAHPCFPGERGEGGSARGESIVRLLRGTATVSLSTDEIMSLTRDDR